MWWVDPLHSVIPLPPFMFPALSRTHLFLFPPRSPFIYVYTYFSGIGPKIPTRSTQSTLLGRVFFPPVDITSYGNNNKNNTLFQATTTTTITAPTNAIKNGGRRMTHHKAHMNGGKHRSYTPSTAWPAPSATLSPPPVTWRLVCHVSKTHLTTGVYLGKGQPGFPSSDLSRNPSGFPPNPRKGGSVLQTATPSWVIPYPLSVLPTRSPHPPPSLPPHIKQSFSLWAHVLPLLRSE